MKFGEKVRLLRNEKKLSEEAKAGVMFALQDAYWSCKGTEQREVHAEEISERG